ncbi:putative Flp pilus-assembly TadE/G-like protein [Actinomadura pelletieri DSM 43383]|uniref:Putative Flp pilus-assembly TadE/G-like protein n=1 Tax=Actinomadura pelletieri DSM 43383 TaxID=1120940 RepID=A0A495QS72_9ACTN|nr:TadE family protein [Actinomadura pelletieri]RKS76298.1 putative Flp pilus-assembly TadE/G-like protein [Actinomadura pelletieri DSM 43383]
MTDRERDRGTIALYTVLFTPIVLLLAGLLVDGGLAIHARQRAADMAEQAARAGADQIDTDALRRTGEPVLDPGRARAAACDMLTAYRDQVTASRCDADEQEVVVTVQITVRPQLLGIIPGLGEFRLTSGATARPVTGGDGP